MSRTLLSVSADAKTSKGEAQGYLTGILYLAPLNVAGIGNICPFATEGCAAACLYSAGRGAFSNVQTARINKTRLFKEDRAGFFAILKKDIERLIRKAGREGMVPVVRLNGTSDLPWHRIPDPNNAERLSIVAQFPNVQFYDYTKRPVHMWGNLPANYDLTFSLAESNRADALEALEAGYRIAAVFDTGKGKDLPATLWGFPVGDADATDLRFTDELPVAGLRAKGAAKKDTSGFVLRAADCEMIPLNVLAA